MSFQKQKPKILNLYSNPAKFLPKPDLQKKNDRIPDLPELKSGAYLFITTVLASLLLSGYITAMDTTNGAAMYFSIFKRIFM